MAHALHRTPLKCFSSLQGCTHFGVLPQRDKLECLPLAAGVHQPVPYSSGEPPSGSTLICCNKNCTLWLLQPVIYIPFRDTHVVMLNSAIYCRWMVILNCIH